MIEAVVFDLDDTLYLESDFVASGYRAVARHLVRQYGCRFREVYFTMMSVFACHGRKAVFPTIVRRFLKDEVPLMELVEVYRGHTPRISLFEGYDKILRDLRPSFRLGIITDGLPEVQRRKIAALGLDAMVDRVICTWDYGVDKQKPDPLGFSLMMGDLRTDPSSGLYIGDSLEKDCRGAHSAGMKCVYLKNPSVNGARPSSGVAIDKAEYVLDSLYKLPGILQSME